MPTQQLNVLREIRLRKIERPHHDEIFAANGPGFFNRPGVVVLTQQQHHTMGLNNMQRAVAGHMCAAALQDKRKPCRHVIHGMHRGPELNRQCQPAGTRVADGDILKAHVGERQNRAQPNGPGTHHQRGAGRCVGSMGRVWCVWCVWCAGQQGHRHANAMSRGADGVQ